MTIIPFHSHEQQDEFIYNLFGQKQNGFFLDISCGNPVIGSNTYTLEKFCNWSGFCFDIKKNLGWADWRTSPLITLDAISEDLTDFLISNIPKNQIVDYISLDVDVDGTNLALLALKRVLNSNIKFKAITFEHECYIHGPNIRNQAIRLLEERGFVCLFEDVRFWTGGIEDDSSLSFEDWWIHPDYFDQKILQIKENGLYYFQCVENLKKMLKHEYNSQHNCCRAWPEEYIYFWDQEDQQLQYDFFNKMTEQRNENL
jgi:hypothetical protein